MGSIFLRIFSGIRSTHNYPQFNLVTYWNRGGREFLISTIYIALIILVIKVFFLKNVITDIFNIFGEKWKIIGGVVIIFLGFLYFLYPIKHHISIRDRQMTFLERSLITSRVCMDKYIICFMKIPDNDHLFFPSDAEFMKFFAVDFTRSGIKRAWERGLKWHLWHRFLRAARIWICIAIFLFA